MANAKVLIVEDEAIVAADLRAKLKRLGYTVVGTASQGESAIQLAAAERPNLVLMDILLAGDMDGIEAADRIRKQYHIPIVFLTAHSDSDTLARAKVTAPFGYLLKPFNERELETHIEMALYRYQIEQALRENEGRLRLAIDATHMGLWDWDIVNNRATWGGHYGDLFGLQTDQFEGSYEELLRLVHDEDQATVRQAMDRALKEEAPYACEFRVRHPDGRLHWLEWWGEVYRDDERRPVRMVGLLQDITPRRQAEEGLRQLTAELEQRVTKRTEELLQSENRLRALSRELNLAEQRERRRLATDLHDYLAQLLVLGRIKLAQAKRGDLPHNSMTLISETETVLTQALSYTRSLVGQLCPPVLKEFGLVVALKWLAEQMQQHHLTVSIHAEGDRLPLADDQAVLMFQSARELLMNIVKHAGTDRATVTVSRLDGVLRVVVEDKGCGFDETVTPMTSQFGLFSIKERMQALGGRFMMLSEAGKGTTATLALPLAMPAQESVPPREWANGDHRTPLDQWSIVDAVSGEPSRTQPADPLVSEIPTTERVRVLLVDDHVMIRQGLKTILEGYPEIDIVGEAANGVEALTLTRTRRPDIVIMDVTMPRMDGIEATRLIKKEWPSVLVIGLSVHSAPQVGDTMREAGAFSILTKEAAVDDLHRTIQQALNSHPGRGGRTGRQQTGDAGAALR